jgi:hypothetical protein
MVVRQRARLAATETMFHEKSGRERRRSVVQVHRLAEA